jgi:hypothetical protein
VKRLPTNAFFGARKAVPIYSLPKSGTLREALHNPNARGWAQLVAKKVGFLCRTHRNDNSLKPQLRKF